MMPKIAASEKGQSVRKAEECGRFEERLVFPRACTNDGLTNQVRHARMKKRTENNKKKGGVTNEKNQ
jgi:hypothetical protein